MGISQTIDRYFPIAEQKVTFSVLFGRVQISQIRELLPRGTNIVQRSPRAA
jgi:hypothetical protein